MVQREQSKMQKDRRKERIEIGKGCRKEKKRNEKR